MIANKTLWFLIALVIAMTAAAFWRLSLLPDWTQVPFVAGREGPHNEHGIWFFVTPLCVLLMIGIAYGSKWMVIGPQDALRAHQRSNKLVLLGTAIVAALTQAFMIARSLGYGASLDGDVISRLVIIVVAILVIVQGNSSPKLPWVSSRFPAFDLDAWQQTRVRRFSGRLSIVFGLVMIAVALLLDTDLIAPIVMALVPFYLGAIFWHAHKVKGEPSPTA
jgi:hypothetical protein